MLSLLRKIPFLAASPRVNGVDPGQVAVLYQTLVDLSRAPAFYQSPYQVPDTLEGRFDLLSLLVGTCCLRLSALPGGPDLSQAVFDLMFKHIERNFREAGVGDLSVPKQMRRMIQAFYGRNEIYAQALLDTGAHADWTAMLSVNVYNQPDHPAAPAVAQWVQMVWWPFLLKQDDAQSIMHLADGLTALREGL